MNDLLTILLRHFPKESDKISQRFNEDPRLNEIAENYRDCVTALQYWSLSKSPESEVRIVEYTTFRRELEQEAIDALECGLKGCMSDFNCGDSGLARSVPGG